MLRVLTWPVRWIWRNRKWFAIVSGSHVLIAVVTLLIINPYGLVWGYLLGEKFHSQRPVSYWRKEFAAGWTDESLGSRASAHFLDFGSDGSPILCDFLRDPDVNVRRVATSALRIQGLKNPDSVPPLAIALSDPDPWVRGLAAEAIGRRGELAREHYPTLLALTADPDPRVSRRAEAGAWGADPVAMAERAGWVTYRSDRGRFTARFPVPPTETEVVIENDAWRVKYIQVVARTTDAVFVLEYTDRQRRESKADGEGSVFTPNTDLNATIRDGMDLSGQLASGDREGGGKATMLESIGKNKAGHAVRYRTLTLTAADLSTDADWELLAVDERGATWDKPTRGEMLRYFAHSFKPDEVDKAK